VASLAQRGLFLIAILTLVASAQQPPPAAALAADYQALLQPTLTQQAVMEATPLQWGPLHFNFARGTLALGAAVEGREMTAVFSGRGTLTVAAPNAIESAQMKMFSGQAAIAETFTAAVFHFSDAAAWQAALGAGAHFRSAAVAPAIAAIASDRAHTIDQDGLGSGARALLALDRAPSRWLYADLKTDNHGWVEARYDPLDGESVMISRWVESTAYNDNVTDDQWTHFGEAGQPDPAPPPYQLTDYDIQLTIPHNLDIQSQTSFTVTARAAMRGILVQLDSNLRVSEASAAVGGATPAPVEFLQPRDPGRTPGPQYIGDWLYLRLPQPLAAGASARFTVLYHGKNVVTKVGAGNFFAQSFGWYPTNDFGPVIQRTDFHLHFTLDHKYTLVATGEPDGTQHQGDQQVSNWRTPQPIDFAGFAFGDFKVSTGNVRLSDGRQVKLEVAVNKEPDDDIAIYNLIGQLGDPLITPPTGVINLTSLAPQAMAQVGAALQVMTAFYGPYPYSSLIVTDVPGDYGQGWPGLLYLSSLSFLDPTQQHFLGASSAWMDELSDKFRAHEVSHQWWGHKVGWATYHDQWLSEGFANFSGVLFQETTNSESAAVTSLERWKRNLKNKNNLGHPIESDGPLWLGARLSSSQDAGGFRIIEYDKGGYVLWMLREMMIDHGQKVPDAAFIAMMKDFTSTYNNRDASTADFQKIAEKHMRPFMDLDHNHTLDWFFREYVYGTGIDKITFRSKITPDAGGQGAHALLTVANPSGWVGLLPIYIWHGKKVERVMLQVHGPQTTANVPLPFVPTRVIANEYDSMLVDVDQ
jgi:hypothetical protein